MSLHAAVHGADGHRQKVDAGLRNVLTGVLNRGVGDLAGMTLGIFAFHARHITEFAFYRHAAAVRHVDNGFCAGDVIFKRLVGGIHHHAVAAVLDGVNR